MCRLLKLFKAFSFMCGIKNATETKLSLSLSPPPSLPLSLPLSFSLPPSLPQARAPGSPVVIVGTHTDQLKNDEKERRKFELTTIIKNKYLVCFDQRKDGREGGREGGKA